MWLPRSTCDTDCLPAAGSVPRVNPLVVAGRAVTVVAVVLLAGLAVGALPLFAPVRRAAALRVFARAVLRALGIRHAASLRLPRGGALVVVNHVSWLDILVLVAHAPVRIMAKHEVRGWPVIGAMAATTGTVFIDRTRPRTLPATVAEVTTALRAGAAVAVFPEGTTWCGRSGGPFRPAMFQAAIDAGAPVVPVTLRFLIGGAPTTVAAFLGEDTLWDSFRRVVAARGIQITLTAHPTLHPAAEASRRNLARAAASAVGTAAVSGAVAPVRSASVAGAGAAAAGAGAGTAPAGLLGAAA
jgi:1-acyl-sn-glycerol-3-phosphate acyltransferase